MLAEVLLDRAALYASGAMTAAERENFELILEFHDELRAHVAALRDAAAAVVLAAAVPAPPPPAALRTRILAALATQPPRPEPEGRVVTDAGGLIEWVDPAFTDMCGFSLAELRGRKPGAILQGAATDPAAVARIRAALRLRQPCCETLVNYHRDGTAYRVEVRIVPILDDAQQPLWFFARERKLPDLVAP